MKIALPTKPLLIVHTILILVLSTAVFRLKYKAAELQTICQRLDEQIAQENETALTLKAEWAYLTRFERLERLAHAYTPYLAPLLPQDILDLRSSKLSNSPCP